MIFFYLPFLYFIHTRLRTVTKVLSWAIIYILPVIYFQYLAGYCTFSWQQGLLGMVGIGGVYDLYEWGYIRNDTETIKKEVAPTLRLTPREQVYYERNKAYILGFRFALQGLLGILLFFWVNRMAWGLYEMAVWMIGGVFALYNRVRSRLSILLYFVLIVLRYISPLLLFLPFEKQDILFFLILIFPFNKTVEFASKPKYGFKWLIDTVRSDLTRFRVVWYFFLLAVILTGILLFRHPQWKPYAWAAGYFLAYRSFIYLFHRLNLTPKEYLK